VVFGVWEWDGAQARRMQTIARSAIGKRSIEARTATPFLGIGNWVVGARRKPIGGLVRIY
jgi:hypothetical protein